MTEYGSFRELLPFWLSLSHALYLPLVALVVSATMVGVVSGWQLRRFRRLSPMAAWTEHARLSWPARITVGLFLMGLPLAFAAVTAVLDGPARLVPLPVSMLLSAASSLAGVAVIGRRLQITILDRRVSLRAYLRGAAADLLLRMPQLVLVLVVLVASGANLTSALRVDWVLLTAAVIGTLALSWFGGLPLCRLLRLARPASERIVAVISPIAESMGIAPRAVWSVDWPVANALAYPHTRELAFSTTLETLLDEDELGAVAAHELAHLDEPRSMQLTRLLPGIMVASLLLVIALSEVLGVTVFLILPIPILVILAVRRAARRMESRADAIALNATGHDSSYARALEKLYRDNCVPAVLGRRRRSHPDLYDRLVSAGVEPDYPRPEPPPGSAVPRLVSVLALAAVLPSVVLAPRLMLASTHRYVALTGVALRGGHAEDLEAVAWRLLELSPGEEDQQKGLELLEAVARLDPNDAMTPTFLVETMAGRGDCDAARNYAALARRRAAVDGAEDGEDEWIEQLVSSALQLCDQPPGSDP